MSSGNYRIYKVENVLLRRNLINSKDQCAFIIQYWNGYRIYIFIWFMMGTKKILIGEVGKLSSIQISTVKSNKRKRNKSQYVNAQK